MDRCTDANDLMLHRYRVGARCTISIVVCVSSQKNSKEDVRLWCVCGAGDTLEHGACGNKMSQ